MSNLNYGTCVGITLAAAICVVTGGCLTVGDYGFNSSHTRTVSLKSGFPSGGLLTTATVNGSVSVTGGDTSECSVTARIIAGGDTEAEAKSLADKVEIRLVREAHGAGIWVAKPSTRDLRRVGISYEINLPRNASVRLLSTNGGIDITNVRGEIQATTTNGNVIARQAVGPCVLRTTNGSAAAEYASNAPNSASIDLSTTNGNVDVTLPSGFTGRVEASTTNGSVKTAVPITVSGSIGEKSIRGTIGQGGGYLSASTTNGSVHIK